MSQAQNVDGNAEWYERIEWYEFIAVNQLTESQWNEMRWNGWWWKMRKKKKSCLHSNSMNNRKVGWNWKKAGRKLYIFDLMPIECHPFEEFYSHILISNFFAFVDNCFVCYIFSISIQSPCRKWIATFEWRKHTHNFCKVKEKLKRNLSFIWFSQCSDFQEFARGNSHQNFRCFGWDALPTRRLHCKLFCACKSKCSINWNEN